MAHCSTKKCLKGGEAHAVCSGTKTRMTNPEAPRSEPIERGLDNAKGSRFETMTCSPYIISLKILLPNINHLARD